jgi:hypothetical protein
MSDLTAKPDPVTHWLKHAAKFIELAEDAQATGDRITMIVSLQRAAECVQLAKVLQPAPRIREPRRRRRRRPYDDAQRRFRAELNQGGHHGRMTPAPPPPEHDAPNELYGGGGRT